MPPFSFPFAFIGWFLCDDLRPCLPGDVISLRAAYGTQPPILTGSGQVTIQGQTHSLFDDASAALDFDGAFVLPEFTNTVTGTVELSAPFAFSGSLQVPNRHESGTYDVFELRGSGVATVYPCAAFIPSGLDCGQRKVRFCATRRRDPTLNPRRLSVRATSVEGCLSSLDRDLVLRPL